VGSELMTRAQSDLEMAAGMIPARGMPRTIDALGRLTRADVTLLLGQEHALIATTLDSATAAGVRQAIEAEEEKRVADAIAFAEASTFPEDQEV